MAELRELVDNAGASAGDALDPITFRLHAQEVRPLLEIYASPRLCYRSSLSKPVQECWLLDAIAASIVCHLLAAQYAVWLRRVVSGVLQQTQDSSSHCGGRRRGAC